MGSHASYFGQNLPLAKVGPDTTVINLIAHITFFRNYYLENVL